MRITDKINFRQPKYMLPAIVYIPLIATGYFVFDMFNTEVAETQDKNLQTTEFLNPNLPGAQIKNGDGIGGKYENMAKSYGRIADYSAVDNIERDNEEEKEAYESKYTEEDLAELVRQAEEKDDAAEVADAKAREAEALEALNKALAEARLRGQAAVAPVAQDTTQAGPPKEQIEVKGQIAEDSKMPHGMKFNIINFVDVEYSRRVNPIQLKYINNLAAASETAETLLESLQKGKKEGGGGSDQFFQTSAVNFLAACIYFFCNYGKEPYDKDGKMLIAERREDPKTKRLIPTGRVFDHSGAEVQPAYWLGKYSDMPHILSFLNESYQTIFEVLQTDNEVAPLLGPFQTAFANKAMEQLEGMIGTLRVYTSRLATKESYWIFHKDGDDFDLKVSDPKNPSYLLIANDPEMESIIGALNALILNRLVTRVNTGQGKNVPVSIIVDELPTLYFHKIDRLIGTARSNKVSVALGFQELPQLEADYGKVGMQKIITTVGNVVSGSARAKETLEWLSSDIFGKVVQLKKGVTIDRDKTSINLNENMDSLVPASKISDMPTGWICGQTARDFVVTKTGMNGSMNIQESEEFKTSKFYCKTDFDMTEIKKEESEYVPLPKFYKFKSKEERERILYKNFVQVGEDVKAMIKEIQQFRTMM